MKIALLSPSIYMSPTKFKDMIFAPRDLAVSLADGLVEKGHDVYFFTAPDVQTKAHVVSGDTKLVEYDYVESMLNGRDNERLHWGFFGTMKHNFEIDLTQRCYHMAEKEHFDIIHSYHERLAHFFNETTGFPTVYTLHDPLPLRELDLKYWLLQKFAHHNYVSISNAFRRHPTLLLHFVDTVYHGIKIHTFPQSLEQGGYIAFMARLIKEKGADQAIQAAKRLSIPLKIASSTAAENINDDEYFNTTIKPNLDPALITFTDFMDGNEKYDFFAKASCLLFPIQWEEPFGMVMIEAMACGTPVVAYNRGSVSEIVRDGVTGFVVDPDRGVDGLVEAVRRIEEIDRAACRKHVEEHFTIEKMVDGYERVYQRVIERNRRNN